MHRTRSQLAITFVAFVLGLLVVAQLRSQQATPALAGMSSQDLTELVGNLNRRNESLRSEIAGLNRELADLRGSQSRGETSLDQLRRDLGQVRAFAGLDPVAGPGVLITVAGSLSGPSAERLINELRNAGAEAIAVDDVRIVAGSVIAGPPGGLSLENTALGDPFEVRAIGNPDVLLGSLTRVSGIVAQLAATEPLATLTVTPARSLLLPATERSLQPINGAPRL